MTLSDCVCVRAKGDDGYVRLPAIHLAELSNAAKLRELIAMSEGNMVERKRSADHNTLAKVISGFANAAGGWLLLGIDDDGGLAGWKPNGRAHIRDWLRDVLDNYLDPLPHFEAEVFVLDKTEVGIVRVPRSATAPHFMKLTGEVFERRNGQTRRASSARARELMLRGDGGGHDAAQARLDDRQAALDFAIALDAPRESRAMHARALASIVRISLIEPSEVLTAWVHDAEAMKASEAFVMSSAHEMNDRGNDWFDPPQLTRAQVTAGGHFASAKWDGRVLKEASVAWDLHGLAGVRFAGMRPDDSGIYYLLSDETRDRWLSLALEHLVGRLEDIAAFGPALVRWDLYGIRGAEVTTLRNGHVVSAKGFIPSHYNNMVALDAEIDVGSTQPSDTAIALWQQLERLAGARPPTT
jgi:hypothetical protein